MKKFFFAFRADLAKASPQDALKLGMKIGAAAAIWGILLGILLLAPAAFWVGAQASQYLR
jgi:hypothetical protein